MKNGRGNLSSLSDITLGFIPNAPLKKIKSPLTLTENFFNDWT